MTHGAYILARYSTDRQNEDTIEVQVERCSQWCRQQGLPVLDIFADLATSGMKDTRPQYARMMQQLHEGGADTVVIYDQSRMFRKLTAWFDFRGELEALGVRVVSVTQPTIGGDLMDPSNFLIEGSMALFNQMWVLQTRQKVIEKMRYMAKTGQHTGGMPPLGYKVVDGALAIEETEAETVRRIFEMYAGGSSYGEIVKRLEGEGRRTRKGRPFGSNSLHDMLVNERYIGTIVYGRTRYRSDGSRNTHAAAREDCIRVEGGCPAIVDPETWRLVQSRMEHNKHQGHGGRPADRPQPLKGKVFCGECGSSMTIKYSKVKGNTYAYYACSRSHREHTPCDNKNIRADLLEAGVAQAVREKMASAINRQSLEQVVRRTRDSVMGQAGPRMEDLTAERQRISEKLDRATDAILEGLNSPALRKKVTALEADLARVDASIQALRRTVTTVDINDGEIDYLLDRVMDAAREDDAAILSLVVRVEVGVDSIRIWTLIDDPDWDDAQRQEITGTMAQEIPLDGDQLRITVRAGSGVPRDMRNLIIIAFRIPRPSKK